MKKLFLSLNIVLFCFSSGYAQVSVTASFTVPARVCVGVPLAMQNTSAGATNYFWSFCAADFTSTPQAVNLPNPSGVLNSPTFGCYAQDDNGNYYGLVDDYAIGHVTRLSFGNSLLNNPTGEDLGDFNGVIPEQLEGIQLERVNGNWTAVIVGGGGQTTNSDPRVVKLDFGNSLTSTPTATNWGNVGGLNLPHDLFITQEAGNFYGVTINVNDNTITRLSFGADFTNQPTGVNMGNIGNIDYPAGLTYVYYNKNLYVFIANRVTNSLTRLDFGNSILNTPTGVNIGDPGGYLAYPRDISLFTTCSGIYGFVTNETSNELVQLDFGSDPTSNPTATDLGNIGNLDFPHSISDFFRVGNDIYAFIPNVLSNTLTRLRFAGCQNIPGSSAQNPPPVTYTMAGVYTINLLVDLGLPTQTSFCQQVTVNPAPVGGLRGDTVCFGSTPTVLFIGDTGTAPFVIGYTDGQSGYSQVNLSGQSAIALPYALTAPGVTTFTLQTITDANGCMATTDSAGVVQIDPLPQGGISGNNACSGDSVRVLFQGQGAGPFGVALDDGGNSFNETGVVSGGSLWLPPATATTLVSLLSLTDANGCVRTSGFNSPSATFLLHPSPQLAFDSLQPVCLNKAAFTVAAGSETSGLAGSGVYSGAGIDGKGDFSPLLAGVGEHLLTYTYSTAYCADSISGGILVEATPAAQPALTTAICGGMSVTLIASGGSSYNWSPAAPLNNPGIADPVATPDLTTTFIATVSTDSGCLGYDTITVNVPANSINYFVVPNAFTPNGDGHNDCFGIQHWAATVVNEFDVYNRWGTLVFTTKNPSDCWDGSLNGVPQPAAAYVYVIKAVTPCGPVVRTGTVMLLR